MVKTENKRVLIKKEVKTPRFKSTKALEQKLEAMAKEFAYYNQFSL